MNLQSGHAAAEKDEHEAKSSDEGWGGAFSASVGVAAPINYQEYWIVDSGCGHHLIGDESKFSSSQPYSGNNAIITADDTVHSVEREGVVSLGSDRGPLKLRSVYHVPGMRKNLFSVSNAVDAGYHVLFGPTEVKFL